VSDANDETPNETDRPPPPEDAPPAESSSTEPGTIPAPFVDGVAVSDVETTVNLTGDALAGLPARDDAGEANDVRTVDAGVTRAHLKGLLEALVFASDRPIKSNELARSASAPSKEVKELLGELKAEYATRGIQLDEVAGGWIFRTNAQFAPFVRDMTKQKPVRLTRAQLETLAILAYRQPITRPEIDDIRGVDCGPVLKLLLERDLIKILGKKDEPGRPILYGTSTQFLEFFGLKSLKDLPTLKEFTELNEDSMRVVERELGDALEQRQEEVAPAPTFDGQEPAPIEDTHTKTDPPPPEEDEHPDTDSHIEAAPVAEEMAHDAHDTIPPAARKPGPWELAADGEDDEEVDDEVDEDDEEDDDEDDEDDEDEDDEKE
jgi:segregation and condensation protein B